MLAQELEVEPGGRQDAGYLTWYTEDSLYPNSGKPGQWHTQTTFSCDFIPLFLLLIKK